MVVGLDIKYSVMLIPVTMFCYLTAIMNPIIILRCKGPHCRKRMRSKYDSFDDDERFDNYDEWLNDSVSLQANGNVTLIKFNHGYVKCDSNCDDCKDKDGAKATCENYNDTEYQSLLLDLANYSIFDIDIPEHLPDYLNKNCSCRDWCSRCDDTDLVALHADEDGLPRHVNGYWNRLQTHCKTWQSDGFDTDSNELCALFDNFYWTMALTIGGFAWLGVVLALMMFMEYTNFHIFYDGKCKFCFRTPCFKKILFTVLLIAPVSFMMVVGIQLKFGNTEDLLNKYFELIGAEFEYDWDTRGVIMFWISMGLAITSILVMILSGKTRRHLRTVISYKRGVEYEGVSWKPHIN